MGFIDLAAVLEPLDFVLPQRETLASSLVPEVDIATELNSLTFKTQLKEPRTDPEPTMTRSSLRDHESEADGEPTALQSEDQDEETIEDKEFSLE